MAPLLAKGGTIAPCAAAALFVLISFHATEQEEGEAEKAGKDNREHVQIDTAQSPRKVPIKTQISEVEI